MTEPKTILGDSQAYRKIVLSVPMPDPLTPEAMIHYRTEIAELLILEDIRRKVLPETVKTISELHDYIDANLYLIDEERGDAIWSNFFNWDWDAWKSYDHLVSQTNAVDNWLRSGRKGKATDHIVLPEELSVSTG